MKLFYYDRYNNYMKLRQYRSRQGRDDAKYEDSAAIMFYAMTVGLILILTYSIITYAF